MENILELDAKIHALLCPCPVESTTAAAEFTTWFLQHCRAATETKNYGFYLIETIKLLQEYEDEMKRPRQITFSRKKPIAEIGASQIVKAYLYVLSQLPLRFDFLMPLSAGNSCGTVGCACARPDFVLEDNDYFTCCTLCGERFELGKIAVNYGDSKRLVLSTKNPHDKKHHFAECIDKFQGIGRCDFVEGLFKNLEKQLEQYGLLNLGETERSQRFARVKKDHIKLILRDTYRQYKEDVNVIYRILTDKPLAQIGHLKDRLLRDFCIFDERYNQLFSTAEKSAYHYYLILYQLLCSYGYPCRREDFTFLKTAERKLSHDVKYQKVFQSLEWSYNQII